MLADGLVDEVRRLMQNEAAFSTAAQAIGYKEIAAALRGEQTLDEAVETLKQATRNYAKRQLTWFRRDARVHWVPARDAQPPKLPKRYGATLKQRGLNGLSVFSKRLRRGYGARRGNAKQLLRL